MFFALLPTADRILLTKAVPIFGNQWLPTEGQTEGTPQYLGGLTRLAF